MTDSGNAVRITREDSKIETKKKIKKFSTIILVMIEADAALVRYSSASGI